MASPDRLLLLDGLYGPWLWQETITQLPRGQFEIVNFEPPPIRTIDPRTIADATLRELKHRGEAPRQWRCVVAAAASVGPAAHLAAAGITEHAILIDPDMIGADRFIPDILQEIPLDIPVTLATAEKLEPHAALVDQRNFTDEIIDIVFGAFTEDPGRVAAANVAKLAYAQRRPFDPALDDRNAALRNATDWLPLWRDHANIQVWLSNPPTEGYVSKLQEYGDRTRLTIQNWPDRPWFTATELVSRAVTEHLAQ